MVFADDAAGWPFGFATLAGAASTCRAGLAIAVRTVAVWPSSPVRKKASALTNWSDWLDSSSVVEAISSDAEAFC